MSIRSRLAWLEKLDKPPVPRITPWDVLFDEGDLDPADPDVAKAAAFWDELLANVPDPVPDTIAEKVQKAINRNAPYQGEKSCKPLTPSSNGTGASPSA
jgi:hypothetical protein